MASVTQQFRQQIDDLPLDEVPCYLCGREDGVTLVDDPPFVVKLCAGCGLGYTSPRLCGDRIHELYDDGYFNSDRAEAFGYDDYHKDIQAYLKTFRRKLKALGPHLLAGSSVLEVGCAGGAFLKVMHDRGHEVWGIELATGMVDSVKSKFGFENVFCGKFDEVFDRLPENSFGAVAMFDVIEHVPDPVVELELARRCLKDDGILIIQTQDVNSRARKVLRRRWHHFKQLEHIYHFSPATVRELLDRAGFEVTLLTKKDAGKHVSFEEIGERLDRVLGWPRWLCAPFRWIGRRYAYINPKDEMLIVARKKGDRG